MPRWTPMDVYGRPRMAPRAGCQIPRKPLIVLVGSGEIISNTPDRTLSSDTLGRWRYKFLVYKFVL